MMRIDLVAQRAKFRQLGGTSEAGSFLFGNADLIGITHGQIDRCPGDQEEIAGHGEFRDFDPHGILVLLHTGIFVQRGQ
jgi:hypothetical protein